MDYSKSWESFFLCGEWDQGQDRSEKEPGVQRHGMTLEKGLGASGILKCPLLIWSFLFARTK